MARRWWWRWVLTVVWDVRNAVVLFGYRVRPYDLLADRRRWWWQPRQRCGFARVRISPATEVVSRELAERLGIVAAWDAQRRREQGGGRGAG